MYFFPLQFLENVFMIFMIIFNWFQNKFTLNDFPFEILRLKICPSQCAHVVKKWAQVKALTPPPYPHVKALAPPILFFI